MEAIEGWLTINAGRYGWHQPAWAQASGSKPEPWHDPVTGKRRRENRGGYASEEQAWSAALDSRQRERSGRRVDLSRRTVAEFFDEWLSSVSDSLKPSTLQNYTDYGRADK